MMLPLALSSVAAEPKAPSADGADATKPKTETRDRSAVAIAFLPPPLENATYSLGIYEAKSGKLVRTLQQSAAESAFTVGLNGLMTQWDRKDDAGKTAPPGKYAARGYAVGALKVEGVAIHGNDWVSEDESLRIKQVEAIALVPADSGLIVLARMADNTLELMRFSGDKESKLLWRKTVPHTDADAQPWIILNENSVSLLPRLPSAHGDDEVTSVGFYQVSDGAEIKGHSLGVSEKVMPLPSGLAGMTAAPSPKFDSSPALRAPELSVNTGTAADKSDLARNADASARKAARPAKAINSYTARAKGKDGSVWLAGGYAGLAQQAADSSVLRAMEVKPGEPAPRAVSASTSEDRLYLLEEKAGWQRVRGLSWIDAKDEGGKKVSTWETFFERDIRAPDPALGLEDPATAKAPSPVVELSLAKNELSPGKPARASLIAGFDAKGSYLETADGLRLRQIGERANLRAVKLAKGKAAGSLTFFQTDGAAWDEFSIEGADKLMSFDAGEFELTATGEKPIEGKAPEPDL